VISCFNRSNLARFWVPNPRLLCFMNSKNKVNPYQRNGGNPIKNQL